MISSLVPLFMIAAYGYVLYRWAISSKDNRVGKTSTKPLTNSSTPARDGSTKEGSQPGVQAACAITERL